MAVLNLTEDTNTGEFDPEMAGMLGLALITAAQGNGTVDVGGLLNNALSQQRMKAENDWRAKQYDLSQKRYQLEAQQAQREAEKFNLSKQTSDAAANIIGQPGVQPGFNDVPLFAKPVDGAGVLGGKIPMDQARTMLAAQFFKAGDTNAAANMIGGRTRYGQPQDVMDSDGSLRLVQFDEEGNMKPVEGYQPIPKKGTSLVVGPDGQVEFSQGGMALGGNSVPNQKTTSDLQGDIATAQKTLTGLDQIADNYKSDYLTYFGRGRAKLASELGKTLGNRADASFLAGRTKFKTSVEQFFNQYRKEITGAAASVQELDRLKQSMLNTDLSPVEFEAAYSQFRDMTNRSLAIKQKLLAQGIPLGSKEFGQRMDTELLSGGGNEQSNQANPAQQAQPMQANMPTQQTQPANAPDEKWNQWRQEMLNAGADPKAVDAKIRQLRGG